ncbi:MAG: type II toxin-antitoxin system prevent-host-death family antitoxin [Chloroflexi bacterium]|nr:type II toxin-antitoxin system prevent-host-death family antitoxin [Chloroflexota bacterium]
MASSVDLAQISDWKEFLKKVKEEEQEYIVKEGGEPLAAIISLASYELLRQPKKDARQELLGIIERVQDRTRGENVDEIESLIEEAIRESRTAR